MGWCTCCGRKEAPWLRCGTPAEILWMVNANWTRSQPALVSFVVFLLHACYWLIFLVSLFRGKGWWLKGTWRRFHGRHATLFERRRSFESCSFGHFTKHRAWQGTLRKNRQLFATEWIIWTSRHLLGSSQHASQSAGGLLQGTRLRESSGAITQSVCRQCRATGERMVCLCSSASPDCLLFLISIIIALFIVQGWAGRCRRNRWMQPVITSLRLERSALLSSLLFCLFLSYPFLLFPFVSIIVQSRLPSRPNGGRKQLRSWITSILNRTCNITRWLLVTLQKQANTNSQKSISCKPLCHRKQLPCTSVRRCLMMRIEWLSRTCRGRSSVTLSFTGCKHGIAGQIQRSWILVLLW